MPSPNEVYFWGRNHVITGPKNSGKSFTMVANMQRAIQGDFKLDHPVEVITNLCYVKGNAGGHPKSGFPKGVNYADTMAETMRITGHLLKEYDGDVSIWWVLDEAQNYLMPDKNYTDENQYMKMYLANSRKFHHVNFFLTPAISNLPPKIRCFPDGERKVGDGGTGYCTDQWFKNPNEAKRYFKEDGYSYRNVIFYRKAPGANYVPMLVMPTSWTVDVDNVKPGCYCFDSYTTAMFDVGTNEYGVRFNLDSFMKEFRQKTSFEFADCIDSFFSKWDVEGSKDGDTKDSLTPEIWRIGEITHNIRSDKRYFMIAENGRKYAPSYDTIGEWLGGIPGSTVRTYYNKCAKLRNWKSKDDDDSSLDDKNAGSRSKQHNEPCADALYIQPNSSRGVFSAPLASLGSNDDQKGGLKV